MTSSFDSVGTLLAEIANLLNDSLRIFQLSDKRHWGADEHEQLHALEETLDEAKRDFQALSPLVHGQSYYELDRQHESVEELRRLRSRFSALIQNLKDWSRSGGPTNPTWVRDTQRLRKDLHRAQCRAARRIFASDKESSRRCLGGFLVQRVLQRLHRNGAVADGGGAGMRDVGEAQRQLAEVRACSEIGGFERFGEDDIAFICDFCDGHLVWEDLERIPTSRYGSDEPGSSSTPPLLSTTATAAANVRWQATGTSMSTAQPKLVVFAPVAIANHAAPAPSDWQASITCPFCEEVAQQPQEEDDDEDAYKPEGEFDDMATFQDHLEWQHPAAALPTPDSSTQHCRIM
ncbi:hypothetical protein DCS_02783 [Drechmeria coniospora]|uniref:Uncharacterized protein n=1 Tax=Drechmeria coniospora TaxID=98403 RepID=A0A151GX31_DRECN|nr:hypothetical protein DCS_02783 [Drechmeria coniospora]KYK61640.1 hypothetical protein DCS_02783 [Drechmeria coniospora]